MGPLLIDPRGLSSDVLSAERYDLAGQHSAAIDSLVAGVRKQDLEAGTRLGKRLLIGDRAPLLPREATGLLTDACQGGGAEAEPEPWERGGAIGGGGGVGLGEFVFEDFAFDHGWGTRGGGGRG